MDILPSNTLPLGGDTSSSTDGEEGEDIVLGRSRGEQNPDGSYHGKITIFSLFGGAIVPDVEVESDPGEEESFDTPFNLVLLAICEGSEGQLCLFVLDAESETTNSGSTNSFDAINLNLGGDQLRFSLLESNGNIEEDSSCQRAHGDSSVARFDLGEESAAFGQSSTDSEACNNGPSSQENDSSFFTLGGEEFPDECADGEEFGDGIPFLIAFACNADDTNGEGEKVGGEGEDVQQAPVPYGVREALTLFLVPIIPDLLDRGLLELPEEETAFLKLTAAASESHAVAPPRGTPPTTPAGVGAGAPAGQVAAGPNGQEEGPGPVSREAGPGTGELAFTGSDVLILALIGAALVIAGLTATRLAVRHRRPAA